MAMAQSGTALELLGAGELGAHRRRERPAGHTRIGKK
eukprot:CAMPEP_0204145444 /NCGR_PEP_ID=MMETSP0361-20130328/21590_1 /ASSEMBLY_ACC=CAM_ASM_000343 /TAXON_ID=268821 /ORGANISM="Scrippsiella Hangoei, Strain SHTV-5" /LENGTH=36 /DNA_ID= /DNA_START= /DNA_END= /DNA_ORIENTATION=